MRTLCNQCGRKPARYDMTIDGKPMVAWVCSTLCGARFARAFRKSRVETKGDADG